MAEPSSIARCLVLDFGAGSGRAMLAELAGDRLHLREIHRFDGLMVERADGPHWDAAVLLAHVEDAIRRVAALGLPLHSIGIDSWGLDYGLLDSAGRLLGEPYHYRHVRSERGRSRCPASPRELFLLTGAQDLPIKTLYQLLDECQDEPDRIRRAATLLMIADLVTWHLTGEARAEVTLAATSGLLDRDRTRWCLPLCDRLGIPTRLLPALIRPGEQAGMLRAGLAAQGGCGAVPLIAVAAHDTASAVAALPLGDEVGFLICGSWLLLGLEERLEEFDETAQELGFGYESGLDGRAALVRSLNGLHLIRKLRQSWLRHTGRTVDDGTVARLAAEASSQAVTATIDTEDPMFFDAPDMLVALRGYCSREGIALPDELGALALALYRGVASEVGRAVERLRASGRRLSVLILCGGGAQDRTLCQLVADASGCEVRAGPVEASAFGNAIIQLLGLGRIESLQAGRDLVGRSVEVRLYSPVTRA